MIVVSACLLGTNCKYNGGNNLSDAVAKYVKSLMDSETEKILLVCPETEGGLPTPRPPAEIAGGKVINKVGEDVTCEFKKGAELCYERILNTGEQVKIAILKAYSPSCGSGKIYDGTFSKSLTDGDGYFARLLKDNGISVITEKELESAATSCL